MRKWIYIFIGLLLPLSLAAEEKGGGFDMDEYLYGHVRDSYEWHITTVKGHSVSIPLPVIVASKTGNGFQNMIGWFLVQLVFQLFEIPNLRIGVLFQIEDLILLVASHHVDSCLQRRALFLLHEKRPIRAAEQSCCSRDHLEAVTGRLLPGVVDG